MLFFLVDFIQGYDKKPQHPLYKKSSDVYGSQPPTIHSMPNELHGKSQNFSKVN